MKLNFKISKKIIIILGLLTGVFGTVALMSNVPRTALGLARAVLGEVSLFDHKDPILNVDGRVITFSNTDDNNQESLIIKSDQEHYTGDSGSDVYFSVTNTSKIDESAILLFYFPGQFIPNRDDPPGTQPATVTSLEQREGDSWQKLEFFAKNIKINDDLLGPAITKRKPIPEDFEIKAGTQIEVKAGETVYFKSRISFRPMDYGEFWIEALGKNGGYGLLDPTYSGVHFGSQPSTDSVATWFASGSLDWTHRKKISINKSKVAGGSDLSNFPVLLSYTDNTLKTTTFGGKAASGSGEFVITSSNGTTVLPHEIERYSSVSGEFIGWVNVTTLSATNDTNLYIYYGGPAAGTKTNQRDPETWNSAYVGVWHLPNGTTLTALDSTSNANNGTVTTPVAIDGKIDGGADFNGTTDVIPVGSGASLADLSAMTISAWINPDTLGETNFGGIIYKSTQSFPVLSGWNFIVTTDSATSALNGISFSVDYTTTNLTRSTATNTLTLDKLQYVTVTWDGGTTAANIHIYVNNNELDYDTTTNGVGTRPTDATTVARIGNSQDGTRTFNGIIDEVRISNAVRSAGWIATEYTNQNSPSTFYALGGLEAKTPANPGLKIKGGVKIK